MNNAIPALKNTVEKVYKAIDRYLPNTFESMKSKVSNLDELLNPIPESELKELTKSLSIYNEIINEPIPPTEVPCSTNKRHLQAFLDRFQLNISDEIFHQMDENTIVEVYTKNHKQIFRTINFFKTCRYDFYTMTFIPWDQLFHRRPEVTQKIFSYVQRLLDHNLSFTSRPPFPDHILTEIESGEKVRYTSRGVGPIYGDEPNEPIGYISLITVKPILSTFEVIKPNSIN